MPTGIAVDSSANVYIAAFDRVLQITRAGSISTMAGSGLVGYPIDGIDARQALMEPIDVALDGKGGLYLSDANSNNVRRVDLATFLISSVAGNGSLGFSGDMGSASSAELNVPWGLNFDSAGNLYIADFGNGRVREVIKPTSTLAPARALGMVRQRWLRS
jgi:hypothetical protein